MQKKRVKILKAPLGDAIADLPSRWRSFGLLYFFSVLVIYVSTMASSIAGGDAGELMGAAITGGVAHPPGFPLYMILAKFFTYLPLSSLAWRVNLLSATAAAAAATFLMLSIWRWSQNLWAAILASALFAFSPVVWTYAIEAEVFSLNNFFVALLLFLSLEWFARPSQRIFYLIGATIGFGWANHHIFIFFSVPLLAWVLWHREYWHWRTLLIFASLVTLGMLCYFQVPLAATHQSLITWGDGATWSGFKTHFFRQEYGTFQLATSHNGDTADFLTLTFLMLKNLLQSTLYIGVVALPFGAASAWKNPRQRPLFAFWTIAAVVYLVIFWSLSNMRLDIPAHIVMQMRFWQQAYVVIFLCLGLGFAALIKRETWQRFVPFATAVLVIGQIGLNYPSHNHRGSFVFETFAKNLLESLPPNALLISQGDHLTNPIRFVQNVLGYRTDVRTIDVELLKTYWYLPVVRTHYPDVRFPGKRVATDIDPAGFHLAQFFAANSDRMIFICTSGPPLDPALNQDFISRPWGFCDWMAPRGSENDPRWIEASQHILQTRAQYDFEKFDASTWENVIQTHYWKSLGSFSVALLKAGIDTKSREYIKEAAGLFESLTSEHHFADAAAFQNLGTAYFHLMQTDRSYQPKMVAAWQKYLELAKSDDPSRVQIAQLLNANRGMVVSPRQPAHQ